MKLFGGKHAQHAAAPEPGKGAERPAASERRRRLRVPLIVLGCVVLLALIVLIGYAIWEKPPETVSEGPVAVSTPKPAVTSLPAATEPPGTTPAPDATKTPSEPEPTPTPEPTPEPYLRKENCYTFAVFVKDQAGGNTDAILIGRLDLDAGTLDFASIPRDTLVDVSWDAKKASAIYAYERKDMERVKEHISHLIGFTVDSYVLMNLNAVAALVDTIGGVVFTVPVNMDYDDPTQNLHIHYSRGEQYLGGWDVVNVLRYRQGNEDYGYGDIGRIETAQKLLKTIAARMLSLGNIANLDNFAQIIHDNVTTDLATENIAFLIRNFLKLDKENIHFYTAPGDLAMIRNLSYYVLRLDEWLEIVNQALNPYNRDLTTEYLDILQVVGKNEVVSTTGESIPITSFY